MERVEEKKEPEDAEEEPERPLYVGIPRSTKKEKAQTAPPRPKGKAADVDSETVAMLVSVGFEVPAIVCQLITPLQDGHPWWSKTPGQVHDKIAVPLCDIINAMSPKVKKLIKENTAAVAVIMGVASLMEEPIRMEMALHREIRLARLGRLPEAGDTPPRSNSRNNKRPAGGLAGAREFDLASSSEENEGDFAF